jgi:hypothetical protein
MRKAALVAPLALLVVAIVAGPVVAQTTPSDRLTATLIEAGRATGIPLHDARRYHCHDLARPEIRCFWTEAERDADVALITGLDLIALADPSAPIGPPPAPNGSETTPYVKMYEHANYGGASAWIGGYWDDLGIIGWNDVVSSFKSTYGGRPKWFWDINYGGIWVMWSSGAWVSYVGDYFNDQFSSVYNYCWGC